jgi:hypothetical protein
VFSDVTVSKIGFIQDNLPAVKRLEKVLELPTDIFPSHWPSLDLMKLNYHRFAIEAFTVIADLPALTGAVV